MFRPRRLLPFVFAGFLFACDDKTGSPPTDYGPLLRTTTEGVILPAHTAFATTADELKAASQAFETTPDADSLAKVQTAWRAARQAYRALDAVHFGPVADRGIGGRIDLAPSSVADIDAIVAQATPIDGHSVGAASGKTKGFLGLEYLIFSESGVDAALTRLRGDDLAVRRRALARAIAEEIAVTAHELEDAWNPGKGGYANELTRAGDTSRRYASQRAAVDDLVGAVGYALELVVAVDLAMPLGLKSNGAVDASRITTRLSGNATADMLATLAGVRAIYGGAGFTERVKARSFALDGRAQAELADCTSKIEALPTPFAKVLVEDTTKVRAAFDACKALKSTWNVEITSALGATLKPTDNDGD